jgi:D-alanine-D-alanine ligase
MKILVLSGGTSNEHEVSQRSGDNVESALRAAGHEVVRADPADKRFDLTKLVAGIDLVFPILHGEGGEDGVLQEQLERLRVSFLGSKAVASRLAFDKVAFKQLLVQHHIATPRWQVVTAKTFSSSDLIANPFILKPIDGGSSIDMLIVRDPAQPLDSCKKLLAQYDKMLLEELIQGQEVTVSILGEQALPVVLIVPPAGEEFDYDNKYNGKSQEIVSPPEVAAAAQRQAQQLALRVHKLTGCRHISRTDIIIQPDGRQTVLEINTMPGLTVQSLLPKAAAATGLDMSALAQRLVELARA